MKKEKLTLRPSPTALLNPRLDANFKTLFTDNSEEGKLALKSFLQAVLNAKVSDVKLLPNEVSVESRNDKQSSFDISCILDDEEPVNIEMQGINEENSYDKRAEYLVAHLLNHYTPKKITWKKIPKTFQISVLNFIYDKKSKESVSYYTMKTSDNRSLSDRMTIVFIELPKIAKKTGNEINDIKNLTSVEKWGKFLSYADDESKHDFIDNLCKSEDGLMAAQTVLSYISGDEAQWWYQFHREIAERDRISRETPIEVRIQDAAEEGRRQGKQEGRQEGIIQTAKNLFLMGFSVEQIVNATKLPLEQVQALQKS